MLDIKITEALNAQLAHEERNSRTYLQIAGWCEKNKFVGAAKWFYKSAADETEHKMKLAHYIADRDELFIIPEQAAPPKDFKSILEIIDFTYELEKKTSQSLKDLEKMFLSSGDFITSTFLHELLLEQIEEEDKVQTILHYASLAGINPPGPALIDDKFAELAE